MLFALVACCVAASAQESSQSPPGQATQQKPATQNDEMLSSYEGQKVSTVELAGQPNLDPSRFASVITQKAGEPFSRDQIAESAAALKKAGNYQQVGVQVEPFAEGLRVMFVLEPAFYFGIYTFPGAEQFPYPQLIQASNYPVQAPFSTAEVEKDLRSLQVFFQQEGYFEAQVRSAVKVDSAHKITNVEFDVTLNRKSKFGSAIVQGGPEDFNDARLQEKLTTRWARLRGSAIRPGKSYQHATVLRARRYLQSLLQKRGYLGARVKLENAEFNPTINRADVHFTVDPGVLTNVQITGARVWPWTRRDLLPVYQGIGVDQETVQEGRQALISHFQSRGFFDVDVDAQLKKEPSGETVIYQITRGMRHKLTAIDFSGNTDLPNSKLMPSVALEKRKRRFFSTGRYSEDLVRTSVKNLTGIYNAEGFRQAKVTSSVQRSGGNINVTFQVVEGPRDIVNAVSVEGAYTFPESQFAPHGLKVRPGEPYSAAHVEQDRSGILANYLRAGYLNASFRETASEVSKQDPHRINVVYQINEGPRVLTGQVITLGDTRTNIRVIQSETASIKPERPLTEQDLLTAGSKLFDLTGVFDWAEVDPRRPITTQAQEDVLVKVHEAKKNEFQYGFGFEVIRRGGSVPSGSVALPNLPPIGLPANFSTVESTFYGPRGTAQYTRNNIHGKGESISVTAFAGRLDQKGAFYYINPNFRWTDWKATTSISIERDEENPIFSSQVAQASIQMQTKIDQAGKDILFTSYSYSKTDLTRILLAELVPLQDQHIRLSTLAANFTRDTRDNVMDAHRGFLGTVELGFNTSYLGSNVDFAKLTAQAAYYKEAIHHIVWANSIRIGLAQPFNNSFVPLSEAFFTGGGNSLRGIPLDSAGPQRAVFVCPNGTTSCGTTIPFPTGGNQQLILNTEARIPLSWITKGLGCALFYDGGNVFRLIGFHDFTSLYSNNIGGGLRYATPVGPIRLDFGYNLNPIPNTQPPQSYGLQYFISIGQAF